MTELSEDTKSAIVYLHSLLKRDDLLNSMVVVNEEDSIFCRITDEEEINETVNSTHNPIQAALENVLQEVCTDCLKLDYYFKDPFFVSLIKSYLEVLISQYGKEVPVTRTVALVCLDHELTPHEICYRTNSGLYVNVDDSSHDMFKQQTTAWFLRVK